MYGQEKNDNILDEKIVYNLLPIVKLLLVHKEMA